MLARKAVFQAPTTRQQNPSQKMPAKKSAAKAEPEATAEIPKGGVLIEACKS